MIKEDLPESIQTSLNQLELSDDGIELAVKSDVAPDGQFGERWLVMANGRLLVFSPDNGARPLVDLPLEKMRGARTEVLVGGGALEAQVEGDTVELARYSNSLTRKFSRIAKRLDAMVKREELPPDKDEEEHRCPGCGRALEKYSRVCPRCISKGKVLRRLLAYARPYWWRVSIVTGLMLLGTAVEMLPPKLMQSLMDNVLRPVKHAEWLLWYVLGIAGMRVVSMGISIVRGRLSAWLGGRLSLDIRSQLNERLQRLSLGYFDKRQVGAVMARVTQDTSALQGFLVDGSQMFVVNILQIIGIGIALFLYNWKLALITLLPTPMVALLSMLFSRRLRRIFHSFWHGWSRLSAVLNDALSGIRVVKAFGQEDREIGRFERRSEALFQTGVRAERLWATFFPTMAFLVNSGSLLVWYFGGHALFNDPGHVTLGTLIAFMMYQGMFYGPVQMLSRITDWLTRSLTATDRIFEVLDTEPEIADDPEAIPMPHLRGEITFENVTFGYDEHKPVLKNIDLKVKGGEMIGLVGRSGAGKTTVISLLCRFYEANQGRVLVDGIDVRKIRIGDLRRQTGVVLQEPFLFSGTIAENIAYAKPDASLEDIMRAAKAANAHDFIIKFADGYDSQVGERGQRLSAGERQRISIARAILHNPRLLILDEATSSVDTETEQQIQQALSRLVVGRTTFAIAHRLSTLRRAERLMVLDEGKMAELGTHDELMEKPDGVYKKLVNLQTELSRIKAVDG